MEFVAGLLNADIFLSFHNEYKAIIVVLTDQLIVFWRMKEAYRRGWKMQIFQAFFGALCTIEYNTKCDPVIVKKKTHYIRQSPFRSVFCITKQGSLC